MSGRLGTNPGGNLGSFLSPQNEQMLDRLVYEDFQRRLGSDLNDRQKQRLLKTVRHYMNEVAGNLPGAPIQVKNKEVLEAVVPDFMSYVTRSAAAPPVSDEDVTRMDVASRFNQLQNERNGAKTKPPSPPEFRITMEDAGPTALSIFEQVKKMREEETVRGEQQIAQSMRSESAFAEATASSRSAEQQVLADRERTRVNAQRESASEMASRLVSPDPRRVFMKDILDGNAMGQGTSLESLLTGKSGEANADMSLAYPSQPRMRPPLQQDTIIRQDDILSYKENEYNLFVYSADRDWLINKSQNRYNFTVNFDPANNGPGQTFAPSATVKFKNITRIELVKTILPIEGLDIIQTVVDPSGVNVYGTSLNNNILSFPYLNVFIPELDTNNFGTDYYLNQAFASLQYDANWVSDNNTTSKGGFLAMIPKFLKCQKVYTPTPLATLRKLTIQIQRPDGSLVADTADTLGIAAIVTSAAFSRLGTDATEYSIANGQYLFIQTSTWFSRFLVNQGDRVKFGGVGFGAYSTAATTELQEFLERAQGHLVVQTAYINPTTGNVTDGQNAVGYANVIIIRSKMQDPTTGATAPANLGGTGGTFSALQTALNTPGTISTFTGSFLNLSHQTTLVFRVITRDLDPTTRIRPDNL